MKKSRSALLGEREQATAKAKYGGPSTSLRFAQDDRTLGRKFGGGRERPDDRREGHRACVIRLCNREGYINVAARRIRVRANLVRFVDELFDFGTI